MLIVGIYLKSKKFEKLGGMLSKMLVSILEAQTVLVLLFTTEIKINSLSICLNEMSFDRFKKEIKRKIKFTKLEKNSDHVILKSNEKPSKIVPILEDITEISLVGYGKSIEIFKQVGKPSDVVKKFDLNKFSGSHAIGHTRMATESAITTDGSHPYSTGEDECLVHNGSLSNHNNLRRKLKKNGSKNSDNDTEVAAGYISDSLKDRNLKQTLKKGLSDLDGFYTFIAGTHRVLLFLEMR